MARAKVSKAAKADQVKDRKLGIKENSAKDKKIDAKAYKMPSSAQLNAGVRPVKIKNKKQKGAVASPKTTKLTK
jgi:hypothetical protein